MEGNVRLVVASLLNTNQKSMDRAEQETVPLHTMALRGAALFQAYLLRFNLHPLDVALASHVRYLTVWNIQRGNPITAAQAAQVRTGLYSLTGVPFTSPLALQKTPQPGEPGGGNAFRVLPTNKLR